MFETIKDWLDYVEMCREKDHAAVCGKGFLEGKESQASWTDAESGPARVRGRPEDV